MYQKVLLRSVAVTVCLCLGSWSMAGMTCYQYTYAPNLVRAAQKILKEQGLYKGAIDGKWGPKTKAAVAAFQGRSGIRFEKPVLAYSNEGQLEERTLRAMFGDEAASGVAVVSNPLHAPEEIWADECQ